MFFSDILVRILLNIEAGFDIIITVLRQHRFSPLEGQARGRPHGRSESSPRKSTKKKNGSPTTDFGDRQGRSPRIELSKPRLSEQQFHALIRRS